MAVSRRSEAPRGGRGARRRPPPGPPDQRPAGGGSELLRRIMFAVPAAFVVVVFIDIGGLTFALFMAASACLCLSELYRLLARWRPVALVGFASATAMMLLAHYEGQRAVLEVAVVTLPVAFLVVAARGQSRPTVSLAGTLLGVYWIAFALAHAVLLRDLTHGKGVLIDVLLGTFLGDTGAYITGRLFGRRPLARRISPNKTLEGLLCGMLTAIMAVFLAGLFQTWLTQGDALLLGLAVAVLGPLGDLFESMVKRDAGTKDTGSLFGPHGGVLDRADAVLFTLVGGYYVWFAVIH
jgi:phosphatidate cytidylyltransferase